MRETVFKGNYLQKKVSAKIFSFSSKKSSKLEFVFAKAELLQLNRTQFPSLRIFVSKKIGN